MTGSKTGWHEQHFYGSHGALVTSVRIQTNGSPHAHITVWTRGGCAGTLTVDRADADGLALRLMNPGSEAP